MGQESDLLQRFFDETDAIVYLKDEEGRYLLLNRRAAESLKGTKEELIGKSDLDVIDREQAEMFREHDREVVESGQPHDYRNTVDLPSGRVTLLDHKFPVSVAGHEHAVGGIAFEVKEAT